MNDNFKLVKESVNYSLFLESTDFYLEFEEYQILENSGMLDCLLTDHRLLSEQTKSSDKYRELEKKGKRWLKYGLGTVGTGPAGIYQSVKHGDAKYAVAGLGKTIVDLAVGGITLPLGILYMWWQRKNTDVCNNKCGGNRNACYYQCYIKAVNGLLKLADRDKKQAMKAGKKGVVKKIDKQIKFYQKKRANFMQKLADTKR